MLEVGKKGWLAGYGWHKHFNPDKKSVLVTTLFGTIWKKIGVLNARQPPENQ